MRNVITHISVKEKYYQFLDIIIYYDKNNNKFIFHTTPFIASFISIFVTLFICDFLKSIIQ